MGDWTAGLTRTEKARLALEVNIVADNTKQVAKQIDRILEHVPPAEQATVLELNAAVHLIRTIQRSLEAKANALADALEPDPDDGQARYDA